MRIEKHAVLAGHTGSVYALLPFGESGLFSAGSDRLVAEWDLQNPEEGNILVKTSDIVYSLLQLPSGKLLVGQAAGGIHVIDLASRKEERLLQYHRSAVFNMVHIPRLQIVLSLSGDGELESASTLFTDSTIFLYVCLYTPKRRLNCSSDKF